MQWAGECRIHESLVQRDGVWLASHYRKPGERTISHESDEHLPKGCPQSIFRCPEACQVTGRRFVYAAWRRLCRRATPSTAWWTPSPLSRQSRRIFHVFIRAKTCSTLARTRLWERLVIGGVPVVLRLLGDVVVAGRDQSAVHDEHRVFGEPLPLLDRRQWAGADGDPVGCGLRDAEQRGELP